MIPKNLTESQLKKVLTQTNSSLWTPLNANKQLQEELSFWLLPVY